MTAHLTEIAGEATQLLLDKGLYLPRRQTLLVADPHFGKAATFRGAGIPIPTGTTADDLAIVGSMLAATGAQRLIILGDFFHAAAGRADRTMATIESWIAERRQLEIVIVRGNHDEQAGDPPRDWGCRCVNVLIEPPFVFQHHPTESPHGYALAGHLHPSVYIADRHGAGLTAPCFWFTAAYGVLPALGRFTGRAVIDRQAEDRVFAVCGERVHEVPARKRLARRA